MWAYARDFFRSGKNIQWIFITAYAQLQSLLSNGRQMFSGEFTGVHSTRCGGVNLHARELLTMTGNSEELITAMVNRRDHA